MSVQVNGTTGVSLVTGIGASTDFDARYAASMPNFTASTTSNLISASLGVGKVDFRNAVLTNGTLVEYNVTSTLTLAMNSTAASLGATTAVATSLIYAIVYAAGTPQLAVCNLTGGLQLDETNLITTTAIGSGSTAANVWYSTSAIATPSQYRVIGLVNATWTSGTGWSSPMLVQPVGVGQAMQNFSNSLTTSGYQKLPSGLIIQWGTGTAVASGTSTVTFPITFPNACLNVVGTPMYATSANNCMCTLNSNTNSQAVFYMYDYTNGTLLIAPKWFAVGY
jgi:hypothetical protein